VGRYFRKGGNQARTEVTHNVRKGY